MYIESYGCQMNFSDSEIVVSVLADAGYSTTNDLKHADLVLINTCSIREKQSKLLESIDRLNSVKKQSKPKSWCWAVWLSV